MSLFKLNLTLKILKKDGKMENLDVLEGLKVVNFHLLGLQVNKLIVYCGFLDIVYGEISRKRFTTIILTTMTWTLLPRTDS